MSQPLGFLNFILMTKMALLYDGVDPLFDMVIIMFFLMLIAYVIGLPIFACYELSKTWKLKNKITLFVVYFGLLFCVRIILFVIPDYYYQFIRYMFFLLPIAYPAIVAFGQFFKEVISLRRRSKQKTPT